MIFIDDLYRIPYFHMLGQSHHHQFLVQLCLVFSVDGLACVVCFLQVRNWEKKLQMTQEENTVEDLCALAEEHLKLHREHLLKPGTFYLRSH